MVDRRKYLRRPSFITSGSFVPMSEVSHKEIKAIPCKITNINQTGDGISFCSNHKLQKGQLVRLLIGKNNDIYIVVRHEPATNSENGKHCYGLHKYLWSFDDYSSA